MIILRLRENNLHYFQSTTLVLRIRKLTSFKEKRAFKKSIQSVEQNYVPPYIYLFIIAIDKISFRSSRPEELKLNGFDAIIIQEEQLEQFNSSLLK